MNDPGWGRGGGDGGGGGQRPGGGDGPPDLDALWRDFNRKLNSLFGSRRSGGGNRDNVPEPGGGRSTGIGLLLIAGVALLLWLGSGFFIVPEGQVAAILRFGEFRKLTERAGFQYRMPYPIESHELVNIQQLRQAEMGYRTTVKNKEKAEALMLTADQSIVDMQYAVQYRIGNAVDWLFNNNPGRDSDQLVRQAAETAMREVVGRNTIDQVLYAEKELVAKDAQKLAQSIADRYKAGITVIDLTIQQVQPPEQVQAAFEDANKAAQDRERLINEGRAYANDVIPKARGAAARLAQEADGYRSRVIATADGDASRFKQLLVEFNKAPQVTRDRLYLETMQQVFSNVTKIYVDSKGGGNLLYLPLDKLIGQAGAGAALPAGAAGVPVERGADGVGESSAARSNTREIPRNRDVGR